MGGDGCRSELHADHDDDDENDDDGCPKACEVFQ